MRDVGIICDYLLAGYHVWHPSGTRPRISTLDIGSLLSSPYMLARSPTTGKATFLDVLLRIVVQSINIIVVM